MWKMKLYFCYVTSLKLIIKKSEMGKKCDEIKCLGKPGGSSMAIVPYQAIQGHICHQFLQYSILQEHEIDLKGRIGTKLPFHHIIYPCFRKRASPHLFISSFTVQTTNIESIAVHLFLIHLKGESCSPNRTKITEFLSQGQNKLKAKFLELKINVR